MTNLKFNKSDAYPDASTKNLTFLVKSYDTSKVEYEGKNGVKGTKHWLQVDLLQGNDKANTHIPPQSNPSLYFERAGDLKANGVPYMATQLDDIAKAAGENVMRLKNRDGQENGTAYLVSGDMKRIPDSPPGENGSKYANSRRSKAMREANGYGKVPMFTIVTTTVKHAPEGIKLDDDLINKHWEAVKTNREADKAAYQAKQQAKQQAKPQAKQQAEAKETESQAQQDVELEM